MSRQIVLASTSPRRKQLLQQTGLDFEVIPSGYEEDMTLPLSPAKLVKQLSFGKASEIAEKYPEAIVIGGDTIVSFGGEVMSKPQDAAEARATLLKLRGQKTQVFTGVTIICKATNQILQDVSVSDVYLYDMTEKEVDEYIATGEPLDKAGSFGVIGKGYVYISRIEGEYTGVCGLPLPLVWRMLQQIR